MRAVLLLLLLASPAVAQDTDSTEVPAVLRAPGYRVVGFVDRPGDCDPVAARFGACVEYVDFVDTTNLWTPRPRPPETLEKDPGFRLDRRRRWATFRNISDLHAYQLEDLSFRWSRAGDGVEETLKEDGYEALPGANRSWQAAYPRDRRALSLPPPGTWLGQTEWAALPGNGVGRRQDTLFRRLRTLSPKGVNSPTSATLMKGRFAVRLGFDGRLHSFDLMDASPESSGPFFEQMFPFTGAMESEDPRIRPLLHLSAPPQLALLKTADPAAYVQAEAEGFESIVLDPPHFLSFRGTAQREFELFRRALGLHLLRFGIEEHTTNQMRVLGALTAMEMPPGTGSGEDRARGRELVAAAIGETDRLEDVESMRNRSVRIFDSGVRVRFEQLPVDIVDEWMGSLDGGKTPTATMLREWNDVVFALYGDLLLPDAPELWSMAKHELYLWAAKALRRGRDPQPVVAELRQIALGLVVEELPDAARDETETWILLDHVRLELADHFDPTPGSLQTPAQMAETARQLWSRVLQSHGYLTDPIAQGLGAVDPLSVCTTTDGVAALDEPRFGAVTLDLLVDSKDGETKPGKVLWAARDRLPFLLVDDPLTAEPTLTRLVGLPGGKALYRIRFQLWSGWHVLWALEHMSQVHTREAGSSTKVSVAPSDTVRLSARTAAVCSDMVLAPNDLIPTLVRAAMLDGELRPAVPLTAAQSKDIDPQTVQKYQDAGSALDDATGKFAEATDAASQAGAQAKAVAEGGPQAAADLVQGALDGAEGGTAAGVVYTPVSERVRYLRDVVHDPLRRGAGPDGLLLAVFDADAATPRPLGDRPPRTPYRRVQRAISGSESVVSSGWAWWLRGPGDAQPALLEPGFQPGNAVGSSAPMPRWRRDNVADGWLNFGTSFVPLRHTDYCGSLAEGDADVVANPETSWDCSAGSITMPQPDGSTRTVSVPRSKSLRTEGFGASVQALLAIWGLGEPRMAFEVGAEARLDLGHGGRSWFHPEDPAFARPWTFRPAVGFLVGFRAQPLPVGIARTGERSWPWGSQRPDGRASLERLQVGLRGGLLIGPGFNGPEGTGVLDVWTGGSLRRPRGPRASLSPYQPAGILGPFARVQLGFRMDPNIDTPTQYLRLVGSASFFVGVRVQMRLAAPGKPDTPDAPAAPEAP